MCWTVPDDAPRTLFFFTPRWYERDARNKLLEIFNILLENGLTRDNRAQLWAQVRAPSMCRVGWAELRSVGQVHQMHF